MVGEKDGLNGLQRGLIRFSFHLEIRHPVGTGKGPGILKLGIWIHLGLTEAHIFVHGIGKVIIHHCISEVRIRTEVSQRIIRGEIVWRDIEQRVGGGIGGETESIALVTGAENREHDKTLWMPAPYAERLAKVRLGFGNVPARSHVEDAGNANRGIAGKAIGFIAGTIPFFL